MKKILFISAFPPSNYGAGVKYSNYLLQDLKKEYYVDLIYFAAKGIKCEIENSECKRNNLFFKLIRSFFFPFLHPFFTFRFSLPFLIHLRSISKRYDLIYFDFSQVFIYSLFIKAKKKVLMSHDVIYQSYFRKGGRMSKAQLLFIKFSEKIILKYANAQIFVFSEKDQLQINKTYNIFNVDIVDFYSPKEIELITNFEIKDYFVFFAGWGRPENHESLSWFIENVISSISNNQKFKIIGPQLPVILKNKIQSYDNIEYIGFVENPYMIISEAKALLAPIFKGAGVKVKCLEALQCGTPVIGTDIAFEGIDVKILKYSVLANSKDEFISAIKSFKSNNYDRITWKKFVAKNYPKNLFINKINIILK